MILCFLLNVLHTLLLHIPLSSCPLNHVAILAKMFTIQITTGYSQAKNDKVWVEAMNKELTALESNHTWDLTSLPSGYKALPSKWVYKLKFKADGSIDRAKARLVIKGFNQQLRIDYKHTFAPVAKLAIIRVIIALVATRGWPLHQLDVNNAFLYGYLNEEIFMLPPQGYSKATLNQVCRLRKIIL